MNESRDYCSSFGYSRTLFGFIFFLRFKRGLVLVTFVRLLLERQKHVLRRTAKGTRFVLFLAE